MSRRVFIAKKWLFERYGAYSLLAFHCSSWKPMRRHLVSGFSKALLSLSHAQKRRALGSRLERCHNWAAFPSTCLSLYVHTRSKEVFHCRADIVNVALQRMVNQLSRRNHLGWNCNHWSLCSLYFRLLGTPGAQPKSSPCVIGVHFRAQLLQRTRCTYWVATTATILCDPSNATTSTH